MSNKSGAAKVTTEQITKIQLDGKVALKINQHCRNSNNSSPTALFGHLLGLSVDGVLQITDCFPLPQRGEDDSDVNEYSFEMMKCLRDVNVDNNTVGWYQSSFLGLHLNQFLIDTQFEYQKDVNEAVVLVYDPLAATHGTLAIKAYRLSDICIALRRENTFTRESLVNNNFSFQNMFEQIPIELTTSNLDKLLLNYFDLDEQLFDQFEGLDLNYDDYVEKNLDGLMSCVYDMQKEQQSFVQWQRSAQALDKKQKEYLHKRKLENQTRKEKGLDLLSETQKDLELEAPSVFKKPQEPSRLDSLLIAQRINSHCDHIVQFAGQSLTKQHIFKSLND